MGPQTRISNITPSLFLLKWVDNLKVFKQTFFFLKKKSYFCAVNLPT